MASEERLITRIAIRHREDRLNPPEVIVSRSGVPEKATVRNDGWNDQDVEEAFRVRD